MIDRLTGSALGKEVIYLAVLAGLVGLATPAWAMQNQANTPAKIHPDGVAAGQKNEAETSETGSQQSGDAGLGQVLEKLGGPQQWTSPEGINSSLQLLLFTAVLSLAPAILLMTTSFVRILVVLGLLRQALGTQQLPPSQVLTSIALFMTVLLMAPVWTKVYQTAVQPYANHEITLEQAWSAGTGPLRRFMADQIRRTGNDEDVYLFLRYLPDQPSAAAQPNYAYYDPGAGQTLVPLQALVPAFMLSELKTAFLIGFQVYLPFVILDLVVASITISMGMMMLPPVLISLPLKLLLFVMVDGWHLVVEMLLQSFEVFR